MYSEGMTKIESINCETSQILRSTRSSPEQIGYWWRRRLDTDNRVDVAERTLAGYDSMTDPENHQFATDHLKHAHNAVRAYRRMLGLSALESQVMTTTDANEALDD